MNFANLIKLKFFLIIIQNQIIQNQIIQNQIIQTQIIQNDCINRQNNIITNRKQ
jgi:hypothetical protein